MNTKSLKNILVVIGGAAYVINFLIIRPMEIKLPPYARVLIIGLMLIYCFFMFQELIKQRKERREKWKKATDTEKEELRKNQKFGWLLIGLFLFLGVFLFGITVLVG
ncbi:MAG: hypothetical protein SFV55_26495 [Haliscomenobacter sp.]|uniref:hypothetical protein n=1 Tax=Haliscomenobacter sp. TaxID=2717303 RepID=UPI0029B058B4|nr:hypothetical protein [Haliscomenobacter sp.]MDX2072011.1 hypothetical protein [Haliscomenobacter sp.]